MVAKKELDTIESIIRQECSEDDVGLWSILWNVRHFFPDLPAEEHRKLTLGIVRAILLDGRIRAGFPSPGQRSFIPWDLTTEEVIARISSEWDELGREPNIGDIVWFTAMD
jgi:hypothetical protein